MGAFRGPTKEEFKRMSTSQKMTYIAFVVIIFSIVFYVWIFI